MKLLLLPSLQNKLVIDLTEQLPVNPAYTWEALCGLRDPSDLTTVVIHHDALPKAKYAHLTDLELATRIANGHIGNKSNEPGGDPGFPYNIWIRNGQAYLCNNLLAFLYGVPSNNGYTIHVCVSGEYKSNDALTDDDRNVLLGVINALIHFDELPNLKIIKGHGEIKPTACPGFDMNRLRHDVIDQWVMYEASRTLEARLGNAYLVMQQTSFMYSLLNKNDGNELWALHYFDKFMALMKEEGWFK